MANKILFLTSSPRKSSNTNILVDWAAEAAIDAFADVKVVDLALIESDVTGCIACMGCQQHSGFRCTIEDEVQKVLLNIPDFDVIVLATPVYFFGPNAQMKNVIDRWYSLTKPDESGRPVFARKNMTMALISTGGGSRDHGLDLTENMFKKIADFTGMEFTSLLVPNCPPMPGQIILDTELKEKAQDFGRMLAGQMS